MAMRRTHHAVDRRMFTSSGDGGTMKRMIATHAPDKATMERILATHAPDGTYIHLIPIMQIIANIMHQANQNASHHGTQAESDLKAEGVIYEDVNEMLEVISFTINKVAREISWKCIGGADAHTTTLGILHILSNYGWDAKAVITLAAFALNYGEFWLVAQLYNVNGLAKSVARLKQLPDVLKRDGVLKPQFDAVNNLIKVMLDLIHCILKFPELPEEYITPKTPELVTAATYIPTAIYWIIHSIVGCVSILISFDGNGNEHITTTTKPLVLSNFVYRISDIYEHLGHQLDLCYNHINEMKKNEPYAKIVHVMESRHIDNMKPLKHLICLKDDQQPLYESYTKKRVSIDILRRKIVLLFISGLDPPYMELECLHQEYIGARQTRPESKYEVLWLPVVPIHRTPWTKEDERKFEELRNKMPWHSVFHPSLLEPAVIKYIKEVWHFNHKPLLVVMDPQGRIVNTNALHMIMIWGSVGFPFSSEREEALWQDEFWRMELIVDSIEPMIFNWIADGKYICLYGGEDIEWIQNFTKIAKSVAGKARVRLEMLYVGKSNRSEKVQRNNEIIQRENLGCVLPDLILMELFWTRIESMSSSKLQLGKSFHEDQILIEINEMLTYDNIDQGWAVMCHGSNDWIRRMDGRTLLTSLANWEEELERTLERGFLHASNDSPDPNKPPHHCNRLILPETIGSKLGIVICSDCGQSMETFHMFRCCQPEVE